MGITTYLGLRSPETRVQLSDTAAPLAARCASATLAVMHRGSSLLAVALGAAAGLGFWFTSGAASACGGFFCGQQPVDQTAERILFEVGQDRVTMTTQISYSGSAADFAWILPLAEVPAVESLAVYPQKALNALDVNSGPSFRLPNDPACSPFLGGAQDAGVAVSETDGPPPAPPAVNVYVRAEVGPYDAVVVGSESPSELVRWLRTEGYRITPVMEPYVARYTEEGMKFLALKLRDTADVKDLKPFRFTLPGTAPSIPLRLTALAAEPEMSILVFVLANRRFEPKNWTRVEIADDQIRFDPLRFTNSGPRTNWLELVAKGVDAAGGQGWVTEFAGASSRFAAQVRQQVQDDNFAGEEDREGARALLASLEAQPYLTRLYTRVSAEEMLSDPLFGQSALADVDRVHQLSRVVQGADQCPEDSSSTDPCDFATCGAAGACHPVAGNALGLPAQPARPAAVTPVAGCACLPGATARLTTGSDGRATVICQDGRLSFLNPGDREADGLAALPDPCAGFECGSGHCIAMNLTPTCVCDPGFVAVGRITIDGTRQMSCTRPIQPVPDAFYAGSLPALPDGLPGGRDVVVRAPQGTEDAGDSPLSRPGAAAAPGAAVARKRNPSRCDIGLQPSTASSWPWLLALGGAAQLRRLRRATRVRR